VVINDFHMDGIAAGPLKTDAPLIVDANAVLAFAIAFQGPESVNSS